MLKCLLTHLEVGNKLTARLGILKGAEQAARHLGGVAMKTITFGGGGWLAASGPVPSW